MSNRKLTALAVDQFGKPVKNAKTVAELKRLQTPLLLAADLREAAASEPVLLKRWAIQSAANQVELDYLMAEREAKGK